MNKPRINFYAKNDDALQSHRINRIHIFAIIMIHQKMGNII